ncbi:MAG TPA: TfoX/Sxy family protein [Rhizomicrobium sp.]|jgi:DNA transformation protein|nr:TfoX/Sxy family protein [Rhizomicrobium sp.]
MAAKADPHRFDDLFAAFGPVTLRRLFSGEGIYADGLIIGLVIADRIFMKTDEASRKAFCAEGCEPFYFRKDGKRIASSYFAIPERLYDEPEELAVWAHKAQAVARAKPKKKKRE